MTEMLEAAKEALVQGKVPAKVSLIFLFGTQLAIWQEVKAIREGGTEVSKKNAEKIILLQKLAWPVVVLVVVLVIGHWSQIVERLEDIATFLKIIPVPF